MSKFAIFLFLAMALILFLTMEYIKSKNATEKFAKLKKIVEKIKLYNSLSEKKCKIEYPIFYINMDKHANRKKHMEEQLKNISTNFQRIKGFNGYKITNKKEGEVEGIKFKNYYPKLSKSEIGCTISHILAIKKAYKMGANIAMICEDDIMFDTCSLAPSLSEIVKNAPDDWELMQLCVYGTMDGSLAKTYKNIPQLPTVSYVKRNSPHVQFWSLGCYLINRKGMEAVLKVVSPDLNTVLITPKTSSPRYPKFGAADNYITDLSTTYSVLPAIFTTNNTNLTSTIHPEHDLSHIEHSLTMLSAFEKTLK